MRRPPYKMEELHGLAVQINRLLGTPERWIPDSATSAPVGCYFIERVNDFVALSQVTAAAGTTREVLHPAHRGELMRQMRALVLGINLAQTCRARAHLLAEKT